jgi:hypothetical protein
LHQVRASTHNTDVTRKYGDYHEHQHTHGYPYADRFSHGDPHSYTHVFKHADFNANYYSDGNID